MRGFRGLCKGPSMQPRQPSAPIDLHMWHFEGTCPRVVLALWGVFVLYVTISAWPTTNKDTRVISCRDRVKLHSRRVFALDTGQKSKECIGARGLWPHCV